MARLTLVIEEAQLRWLRQRAHDAVMAGKRTDMSAIVRELVDAAMQRERDGEPKPPTPR